MTSLPQKMNFFTLKKLIFLLPLTLHCSSATNHAPLFSSCSGSRTYSSDDPFASNLSKLMSFLLEESPAISFGIRSVGYGEGQVFGLAMCRGDITSSACMSCIHAANDQSLRDCRFKKEVTIWLDHCLLRYAELEFFGEIDNSRKFYTLTNRNESKMMGIDATVDELMERLVKRGYLTPLLFATGEMELRGVGTLFGLVQCTKDLSGGDCRKCLTAAIAELPSCCHGRRGGRVVGASCNLRYELYPFYDSS